MYILEEAPNLTAKMERIIAGVCCLCVMMVGVSSHPVAEETADEGHCSATMSDVIFVLDSSGSIARTDYEAAKRFLVNVVDSLDISATGIHVGMIHYSNSVYSDFGLDAYTSKLALKTAISVVPYNSGGTNTNLGIAEMKLEIMRSGRTGIPKVGVILTDGASNSQTLTLSEASSAKSAGISMISVGIGSSTNDLELKGIASDPLSSNLINIPDFDALSATVEAINKLSGAICEASCGPPETCFYKPRSTVPINAACISDCTGVPNGDYQSCNGCNVYVTCSNYLTYDNRPCPANLVWDDIIKRCEWTSRTCENQDVPGNAREEPPNPGGGGKGSEGRSCISDCTGVPNGDYQSCNGCNVYVTCSNYLTYDNRPCPANLVWDDNIKRCEWESSTCGRGNGRSCISDCHGVEDGDYQSCHGCNVYVTCSNYLTYDNRPCPANLVWDDNIKRCEWTSATCR